MPPRRASGKFPVVALGASAGGLEALIEVFKSLPASPGMGFLVVVHLASEHESQLSHILSQQTKMPVRQAVHGCRVAVNSVYVIPPGRNLTIHRGRLQLADRGEGRAPVDMLFRSLARDQGARAIAIVLSGEGSDGSQGICEVRAEGGLTISQDEATAAHPSMPAAAIATGAVERVLSPQRIGHELVELSRRVRRTPDDRRRPGVRTEEGAMVGICSLIEAAVGVDFGRYKQTTIKRRVSRRMGLRGLKTLQAYLNYLRHSPAEVQSLYDDLLIHVTAFFRDPRAFRTLANKIYPALLTQRSIRDPIRIWVAGCSTGEEVYSHAINLLEYLRENNSQAQVQLFATDVNQTVIETARAGLYSDAVAKAVPPDRLRRYFSKIKSGYRINKSVRDLCVFARQDLVKDPPFSSIDLLSCRNVLIYLGASLQKRIIPILHYALRPNGFLMLGTSETVGEFSDRFVTVARNASVYSKKPVRVPLPEGLLKRPGLRPELPRAFANAAYPVLASERHAPTLERQVEKLLLAQFTPAAVVVDEDLNIVQSHGHTGPFLELPAGKISVNLLKMVREDLGMELRTAFYKAKKEKAPARKEAIAIKLGGRSAEVRLDVIPFSSIEDGTVNFIVLFREAAAAPAASAAGAQRVGQKELLQLRQEVASTREYMRSVTHEQDLANQEVKSANEEILSSNEELQSMNEELETAKEDLQSTNEEMATINEELTLRNRELKASNEDLGNLLASSQIAIVMLGNDLKIRRFTPPAERVLGLVAGDIGRSISSIKLSVEARGLEKEIAGVAASGRTKELEVRDGNGRWYSMWFRPNRNVEGKADGLVVSLLDVTDIKSGVVALKEARNYAESIVDTIKESLLVLDGGMRVKKANRSFYKMFRTTPQECHGRSVFDIVEGRWKIASLKALLEALIHKGQAFADWESVFDVPKRGKRTLAISGRVIAGGLESDMNLLLVIEDITARKEAAEIDVLRKSELQQRDFVANVSHELMTPIALIKGYAETLSAGTLTTRPKQIEFAKVIEQQADRLAQLVEDLLELSRLESGRKRPTNEPILLRPFVRRFIQTLRTVARQQSVSIKEKIPATLEVSMDKAELAQVLQNICENAIKYNRPRGRVVISARGEARRAVISVQDTGIGVPQEDLNKIFERFHRTDRARARGARGTGLGLSIVKTIIQRHGCRIWAQSDDGKGTTFFFTLPMV